MKQKKKKGPCWKGYEAVGMKMKGGRKVPNCVPVSDSIERIYALSLGRLDEFKYKGIEFLPFGRRKTKGKTVTKEFHNTPGTPPSVYTWHDHTEDRGLLRRQLARDDRNFAVANDEVWKRSPKTMPRHYATIKSAIDALPDSDPRKKNPIDIKKNITMDMMGFNPRGTNKAFIRREADPEIDTLGLSKKDRRLQKLPFNSPEKRRETIAHEAWHARFGRLPGALRYLGQSETLASLYGGFRGPKPGSSLTRRIKTALGTARTYGLPSDIDRIKKRFGYEKDRFKKMFSKKNESMNTYVRIHDLLLEKVMPDTAIKLKAARKKMGREAAKQMAILGRKRKGRTKQEQQEGGALTDFIAGEEYKRFRLAGAKAKKLQKAAEQQHKPVNASIERIGDLITEVAAWQRKEGKNPEGGLNKAGVESYRRENPGSKLKTAVTTKPSKLKKGSKSAKRRKSFCARMGGMKKRRTSAKTANDPNSRINKSLRKWNC